MIHFVGAGPGAEDLITLRGAKLLEEADCIIYAGSLVNPKHLLRAPEGCAIYNSATMTLEEVLAVMEEQEAMHHMTVRLHTGDPSMYGAIREQMDALDRKGHAARHLPDPHPDPHGGPDPGPGEGSAGKTGGPRVVHGHLPLGRAPEGSGGGPL